MNPAIAKLVILVATIAMIVIRAPHGRRSRMVPVERRRQSTLDLALLAFAWIAFASLLVWIATPVFSFADYPLHAVPLVTHGVYRSLRHPMYTSLLIYSVGQALVVPNWLVGPSYAVAVLLLVALRLRPEEQMMLEKFGHEYEDYRATTNRLIPGLW